MKIAKVGEPAPDFTMQIAQFGDNPKTMISSVSLATYAGKWLVLFFYPLDFTSVCPTEIIAFSKRKQEFDELDAEILGVSVDSVFSHIAWMNTPVDQNGLGPIAFPLASDTPRKTAKRYGVLIEETGISLRGLFIIDPGGILQYLIVHNLNTGRSVNETLRVLEALQTGTLCPSDWQPGENTL